MENEKKIYVKNEGILRLDIYTENEQKTGEYLEFDLEDIELPLKYAELIKEDEENKRWLNQEQIIINKRQDVMGKVMSKNTEDIIIALNKFFKKEEEIYNKFLGENGVKKLLNGQKFKWTSLKYIDEVIEKQIIPYLDIDMKRISNKIKEKYGEAVEKRKKILEVDD